MRPGARHFPFDTDSQAGDASPQLLPPQNDIARTNFRSSAIMAPTSLIRTRPQRRLGIAHVAADCASIFSVMDLAWLPSAQFLVAVVGQRPQSGSVDHARPAAP